MPKPANRPNKVGEHQKLKGGGNASQGAADDDGAATEHILPPGVGEAFDKADKLFKDATGQS